MFKGNLLHKQFSPLGKDKIKKEKKIQLMTQITLFNELRYSDEYHYTRT